MFNAKSNYYSLETMKIFEAEMLQNFKQISKELERREDTADYFFYESLIETINGEDMGSALDYMQQAATLGHNKAQFVIEAVETQEVPYQASLLINLVAVGQILLNAKDKSLEERYPEGMSRGEEMKPVFEMFSTGNTKEAHQLLADIIKKGSFHAYILLQGPTLKNRSN